MSISAIQNSGVYQSPETRKAQPAAPLVEETPSRNDRIVPEERAFRYSSTTFVAIFFRKTRSCSTKRREGRHWRSSSSICIRENRSI